MEWIALIDEKQIDECIDSSHEKTVVIFKHSTSCGISRMVLKSFEREAESNDNEHIRYFFLDLIMFRSVSNYIAEKLEVRHESPQLIVIKNGAVKHHSSHSSISASYANS